MNLITRLKNAIRGAKQRWRTSRVKRRLWNQEFANGRWDFIENTPGDLIYEYVEKYCRGGNILDLGCGSGNTGCELDENSYENYTGIDISDVAIEKAIRRSEANRRNKKNRYQQSDITTYTPSQRYNVILFRESIYYIPRFKIKTILDHYAKFLKPDGVFIVRWHDQSQGKTILEHFGNAYKLVELPTTTATGPTIIVFRQKASVPN
jgi:2-polyprenyl-3-methyl-5-hydroxy-6-metoxy-1,4-benzoquinol methylase